MSYFILGLLEMEDEIRSKKAADNSKIIVKQALSFGYSIQFANRFEDKFYRYVLDPVHELYDRKPIRTIEFQLSDSPLTGTIDSGFLDFYQESYQKENFTKTPLYKFLNQLWGNSFIKNAVFIFSYGLNSFQTLKQQEVSFKDIFTDLIK